MRLAVIAVSTLLSGAVLTTSSVYAANPPVPRGSMKCIANIGKLDVDNDGYVDNRESTRYSKIMTNVDVNKDGKISPDEAVVACRDDGFRNAFKPSD